MVFFCLSVLVPTPVQILSAPPVTVTVGTVFDRVGMGETVTAAEDVTETVTATINPTKTGGDNQAKGATRTGDDPLPDMQLSSTENDPMVRAQSSATYTVTFQGNWTIASTPGGVVAGAHFTTLIGAIHNDMVTFWESGGTATPGVENVAELGSTGTFKSEINANSNAISVIEKSVSGGGTGSATFEITLTNEHPLVTLLSMIGPSPDWFVGVSGLSLLNAQGEWESLLEVDLFPYDAGTEEGTEFSLNNQATSPQGVIASIKGMGKFSNVRMARLTFTRQSFNTAPAVTICSGGMAGTYPCSNVDLMSFLALDDIGGGSGNDIWGWTDSSTGKEYAIMGRTNGTSFVDISDPVNPIYLGNLPPHSTDSIERDIKVYADHAFIVAEARNSGMQVFDLTQLRAVASPPATFSETAHYPDFSRAHNLAINEDSGFAYAVGTDTCRGGLHMINIQNPTNPTSAGCFSADGYTHDAQCVNYDGPHLGYQGKEICFNSNEDTLTIVDVTNKAAPVLLSRTGYSGSRYTHQGWLTEDQVYFLMSDEEDELDYDVTNTRTYMWDVSELDDPALIGFHESTTTAIDHNQYVKGSYTYQSNYRAGLRILDITDIANGNLSEEAFFDIYPDDDSPEFNGAWSNYPFFDSGMVIVSGEEQGLFVLRPNLVDGVNPALSSASVNGAALTLTYGEALDGNSRPATDAFTVTVSGSGRTVTHVSVSGRVVTLTLASAVTAGQAVTVTYTVPGTNPIRDAVGNEAVGLNNRSVTNTTGAPNAVPEIASVGPFNVRENQALVRRLVGRDTDPGDEVTGWAIVGGADQSQFSIAADTGELRFQTPPDYEDPADVAGTDPVSGAGDNEYLVTVEVKSGAGARELEAEQALTIRVTDEREPPDVPEAPTFSGATAESLTVHWTEPDNTGPEITDYDLQYREKGRGRFSDGGHQGPGLSLTLEDLNPGMTYEVQVQAGNEEGTSDWSESGEGMTVAPLTVEMTSGTEPPVSGAFTVRFSFSEEVRGFSGSDIETGQDPACRDDQNNPVFCDPDIGALQTTDDGVFTTTVTPRTDRVAHNYTLTLRVPANTVTSSRDSKPNQEARLEVRVATPGGTLEIGSLNLSASPGSGSMRLSWNRPTDNGGSAIIRYEVRYQAVGEVWSEWENVGAGSRGVTVGNLVNGREYIFEVRAVNALGKGGAETVQATPERRIAPPPPPPRGPGGGGGGLLFPPEAPAGLMAMPGEGAVRLEWSPPESDGGTPILRYEYRLKEGRGEFGEWTPIADSAPGEVNATGFTVTGLLNGTTYRFELRAVNLVGNGRVSEAVEAVMRLDRAYGSNFGAEDLQGVEASLEGGPFGDSPQSLRLRFGAGLRFEESELDGEGEETETRSGSYGYRYTSRTTGELRLDYDGGEACELQLTFRGVGAGSYSYRCGGVLGGQGSFRLSGLNQAPEITGAGVFEVAENTVRVGRLEAVDGDDEIGGYGIAGGADGGLFAVEAGELLFREAPDYETPGDVASDDPQSGAADNEYIVVVEVRSGEGERERKGSRAIRVRVSDEEEPPGAPAAPVVTAEGSDSLKVSWREPENRGPEIVDYEVRYREGGEAGYSDGGHEGRGLEVRLSGLKEGTVYEVQVRAVNEEGMSEWSEPGEGRTDPEEADPEEADPEDPSDFTEGDLEGRRLTLRQADADGTTRSLELRFGEGNRFEQIESVGEQAATRSEGAARPGSYTYQRTGPHMGTLSLAYDDGSSCEVLLAFTESGAGAFSYDCGEGAPAEGSFRLTTGSLFVPVILSAAGRSNSLFTSELTLTNRGDEEVKLDYTYTAHRGGGSGKTSDVLAPGMQKIETDALTYLRGLGIPIPETGNRIGTLRVEARLGSEVEAVVRTTTVVPEGRAGLAYLGVAEEEGFEEAVYLCGLRQNSRDRSNVAFQNMGAPEEGAITIRTTVYSGESTDTNAWVLEEITLDPGGFHQYSGLLGVLGVSAQGYVKVERVEGRASFYAYGVINDQANSDGSFVFPVAASWLEGTAGQTLPVVVETSAFTSELTVTNFSEDPRNLDFQFVAEGIEATGNAAGFRMRLEPGQQEIIAEVVDELRRRGVAGLGSGSRALAGAVFATAVEGDMSGIVIGARTGSEGGGGQYSVFYNAVPFGEAFSREAWVEGLQQDRENRSNLALVNTGEVDGSASVFHLEIYDGETGLLAETVVTKPIPVRRWHQINGILGSYAPETRQGYIRIEKVSGANPFLAYGVVNDGGAPGERSGDGAYLPARE